MASEGTGAVSSIRVKNQTALDTIPTTGMRSLPFTGITPSSQPGASEKSKMLGAQAAVAAIYNSPITRSIDFQTELGYTTLDDWLCGIIGTPTTGGTGISGDPYTGLYTPIATPLYKYVQIVEGDIPTTKAAAYKNCLVTEVTISFSAANPLGTIAVKMVGQKLAAADTGYGGPATGDTIVSAGLVSVSQVAMLVNQFTVWNLGLGGGDTAACLRSATIKLSRPYDDKRACVGPSGYKAAVYTGPLETSFDLEVEWDDTAIFAAVEAQTVIAGFKLVAVGGVIGAFADHYTFDLRSQKSLVSQWSLPIVDNGKIVQKYTADAYGNTGSGQTYDAISVKLTNNVQVSTL
jgi:Phage tail tube protein